MSSSIADTQIYTEISTAIREQNTSKLLATFFRLLGSSSLTEKQLLETPIYKEALLYLAKRKEDKDVASVTKILIVNVYFPLLRQNHYFHDTPAIRDAILEALQLAVNHKNSVFIDIVLNELPPDLVAKLLQCAKPGLLTSLLKMKPELLQRPAEELWPLLDLALENDDMALAAYIFRQNPKPLATLSIDESVAIISKAIDKNNSQIIAILLQHTSGLLNELKKKDSAISEKLFQLAVTNNCSELVTILLQNDLGLLYVTLRNDGHRPIVSAAKKGKWDIVAAIAQHYYSHPGVDFNGADFYKALLMALQANTPESHRAAQCFNVNLICTVYKNFKDGNILHHAMRDKGDLKSIQHILAIRNKDILCELVRSKNNANQTPIELATKEKNWPAVALHAELYTPETFDDVTLYSAIIFGALQDGSIPALTAVLALIAAFQKSNFFLASKNLLWIVKNINHTIVGKSTEDLLINQVFSSLLALPKSAKERIEVLTDLAGNSKKGSKAREKYSKDIKELVKNSSSHIKNNIIDLISQIADSMLKIEVILDFLEDKSTVIWKQAGLSTPTLLDGTREKLIHLLMEEFKKIVKAPPEAEAIADFIKRAITIFNSNATDVKSKLNIELMTFFTTTLLGLSSQLTVEQFISSATLVAQRLPSNTKLSLFSWKDETKSNILKDFLLIINDQDPLFQQVHATDHAKDIRENIVAFYTTYIKPNPSLQRIFLSNLLKDKAANKDSAIWSALSQVASKDLEALSSPSSQTLYPSLSMSASPPSASSFYASSSSSSYSFMPPHFNYDIGSSSSQSSRLPEPSAPPFTPLASSTSTPAFFVQHSAVTLANFPSVPTHKPEDKRRPSRIKTNDC